MYSIRRDIHLCVRKKSTYGYRVLMGEYTAAFSYLYLTQNVLCSSNAPFSRNLTPAMEEDWLYFEQPEVCYPALFGMDPHDWSGLRSGCRRSLIPGSSAAFNMAAHGRSEMDVNVCYCVYLFGFLLFTVFSDIPGNKYQVTVACLCFLFLIMCSKGIVRYISARVIFVFKIIYSCLVNMSLPAYG